MEPESKGSLNESIS